MARGLQVWSKTAATNSAADGGVNWAEGMAPSAVNDSARAEMASMAMWRDDNNGSLSGTLSTATYSVTSNQVAAALTAGYTIAFQLGSDMPATALLNLDGLGAKPLRPNAGVDFLGSEYKANQVIRATYFASNSGEWLIAGTLGARDFTVSNKLTCSSTGDMVLPVGTTGQQPSAEAGGFRYNSTKVAPEFSDGASWLPLLYTLAGAQLNYGGVANGTIVESHTGNAVTFALKTLAGSDPSAGDPVLLTFRNATVATGNYVYRIVTAALSLTISSGSLMGASNGIAFKVWIVLFDDGGTIKLGAINCVSGTSIYPLGQVPLASSTADDALGGSDSAQVFYTKNGVAAVTSKAYVVLGYAAYESGLATAGNWASPPTRIQLFGAGIPLPGSVVQSVYTSTTTSGTTASATFAALSSTPSLSITPTSAANLVRASAFGSLSANVAATCAVQFQRGSTLIGVPVQNGNGSSSVPLAVPAALLAYDSPGATSSQTYSFQGKTSTGTMSFPTASTGVTVELQELMA